MGTRYDSNFTNTLTKRNRITLVFLCRYVTRRGFDFVSTKRKRVGGIHSILYDCAIRRARRLCAQFNRYAPVVAEGVLRPECVGTITHTYAVQADRLD